MTIASLETCAATLECCAVHFLQRKHPGFAISLNQYHDWGFIGSPAALVFAGPLARLAADIGFIGLDRPAQRFQRAILPHGLPDAMIHEPRRLLGNAALASDLVGTDPLLAAGHQVKSHQPLVNRNLAIFHDRSDAHCELFSATAALVHARTDRGFRAFLRSQLRNFIALTVRAYRAIRPALRFKEGASGFFVRKHPGHCRQIKVSVGFGRWIFGWHCLSPGACSSTSIVPGAI
jgi:hypothetical protein